MPEFDGFRYGQVGNFDPNNMTILYPIGMGDLVYALAQPLGNIAYLIKTQPNHNRVIDNRLVDVCATFAGAILYDSWGWSCNFVASPMIRSFSQYRGWYFPIDDGCHIDIYNIKKIDYIRSIIKEFKIIKEVYDRHRRIVEATKSSGI